MSLKGLARVGVHFRVVKKIMQKIFSVQCIIVPKRWGQSTSASKTLHAFFSELHFSNRTTMVIGDYLSTCQCTNFILYANKSLTNPE